MKFRLCAVLSAAQIWSLKAASSASSLPAPTAVGVIGASKIFTVFTDSSYHHAAALFANNVRFRGVRHEYAFKARQVRQVSGMPQMRFEAPLSFKGACKGRGEAAALFANNVRFFVAVCRSRFKLFRKPRIEIGRLTDIRMLLSSRQWKKRALADRRLTLR